MNITTMEIIDALKLIQDMCKHTSCNKCMCSTSSGHCVLMKKAPLSWQFIEPVELPKVVK